MINYWFKRFIRRWLDIESQSVELAILGNKFAALRFEVEALKRAARVEHDIDTGALSMVTRKAPHDPQRPVRDLAMYDAGPQPVRHAEGISGTDTPLIDVANTTLPPRPQAAYIEQRLAAVETHLNQVVGVVANLDFKVAPLLMTHDAQLKLSHTDTLPPIELLEDSDHD